jgi:hypothetical protein
MDEHNPRRAGGPFSGHGIWWWASAAVTAVAVVGAMILFLIPL